MDNDKRTCMISEYSLVSAYWLATNLVDLM
jgi:hypothetical protein